MIDIMLDLETLSLDNNAVVVSISAVEFDLTTGEIGKTFEKFLDITEQVVAGGHISESTCKWWSEQSAQAKSKLVAKKPISVVNALKAFNTFLLDCCSSPKDARLWGNGISADNVWIRNLYQRHMVDFPLPYWCDKDVRTLTGLVDYAELQTIQFTGVKHNGLDDCKHQIKTICKSYNLLRGVK